MRSIRSDIPDVQELLRRAVAEGDVTVIAAADQRAMSVRTTLPKLVAFDRNGLASQRNRQSSA